MKIKGVWLPVITPFIHGELDHTSYANLLQHYLDCGISGLIPLGTTGENSCVSEKEFQALLSRTMEVVNRKVPVYVGFGGNNTSQILHKLKMLEPYGVDGILSVCPYYNRPSQEGLYNHFLQIAEATSLDIMIYNIPYRTGVNLENRTLLRLAEQRNVVAVKDSCGDIKQTLDLLMHKPEDFSVLTGEDRLFFSVLANGGDGGVMASAHIQTEKFLTVFEHMQRNDHQAALDVWRESERIIPLLFEEPNPAPIKYILEQQRLIQSSEVRPPLTQISENLQIRLDGIMAAPIK